MQAQNCSNYAGSWRHPPPMPDFMTPEYYQRIARTLEEGKFDLAFFDDRLAMPDIYGDDHAETVAHGMRCVKLDPLDRADGHGRWRRPGSASARPTRRPTTSRSTWPALFATLDLMTNGRVAWNVVTSLNDSEAANFGHAEHLEHDLRYDRADEFMEVVIGHWDTWEDDALIIDKASGRFADPDKVHRLDHRGKFFKSRGPVHRAALGAGPSGAAAGRAERPRPAFAARWAELIFASTRPRGRPQKQYAELKDEVAEGGPRPGAGAGSPRRCYVIVGETRRSAAGEARATIDRSPSRSIGWRCCARC